MRTKKLKSIVHPATDKVLVVITRRISNFSDRVLSSRNQFNPVYFPISILGAMHKGSSVTFICYNKNLPDLELQIVINSETVTISLGNDAQVFVTQRTNYQLAEGVLLRALDYLWNNEQVNPSQTNLVAFESNDAQVNLYKRNYQF